MYEYIYIYTHTHTHTSPPPPPPPNYIIAKFWLWEVNKQVFRRNIFAKSPASYLTEGTSSRAYFEAMTYPESSYYSYIK